MSECLKVNSTITSLNLDWNELGLNGATIIGKCLAQNYTLVELYLDINNIEDVGIALICRGLRDNEVLKTICLGANKIGTEGVIAISECLKYNTTLTEIRLAFKGDGDIIGKSIVEALKINHTICKLEFYNSYIPPHFLKIIESAIIINRIIASENIDRVYEKKNECLLIINNLLKDKFFAKIMMLGKKHDFLVYEALAILRKKSFDNEILEQKFFKLCESKPSIQKSARSTISIEDDIFPEHDQEPSQVELHGDQ